VNRLNGGADFKVTRKEVGAKDEDDFGNKKRSERVEF